MITSYAQAVEMMEDRPEIFDGVTELEWFKEWLAADNFHILVEFQRWALTLRLEGKRDYYSARAIWHRMRWDTLFKDSSDEYKLSDHPTPYLARLIMAGDSRLTNLFRLRGKAHPSAEGWGEQDDFF